MVKFLIGVAVGIALVLLSFVLLLVVALQFREKPPVIADHSVLVMRIEGELPEKPPLELPNFFGDDKPPVTLASIWSTLEKSAKPVFAYLRQPGAREYYIAAGTDRIWIGPAEPLMLKGLRAEMMYFKN